MSSLSGSVALDSAVAGGGMTSAAASATAFAVSISGSGITGAAATVTVTPNGPLSGDCTVSLSADAGATMGSALLSFAAGATAAQTTTLTPATDGAHSVTISNSLGLTNIGSPATYTSSAANYTISAAYRNGQPYLFSSIVAATEPARVAGGTDLIMSNLGTMREYVDQGTGWPWDNAGGDWIDSTLTRMGTTPWASMSTGTSGVVTYSASVTSALQHVQTTGRWNAWIVSRAASGAKTVAGRFHATTSYRPRIDVTYADATTATLACRVSAFMGGGSTEPSQGGDEYPMSTASGTGEIALEFDLPTKAVSSATLYFTVTNHWGISSVLQFNLADPPVNTDAVTQGIAAAYPLDAGLSAHPSVIGQHRYNDGTVLADYKITPWLDWEAESSWDPALWGGTSDTSKLPHYGLGKFMGLLGSADDATVVSSSYSGDGFAPLAPGMGALRVPMAKPAGITDGWEGGQNGTKAADAMIFMPFDKIGLMDRLFVRYYMFIGTTADTGNPYRVTLAQKYQVLKAGVPTWTDMAGKCSISAGHKTKIGGNSGTSGGGYGWTTRREFADDYADPNSPAAGGWDNSWSWYDYQNNPSGHNYGSGDLPAGVTLSRTFASIGQRGGLGGRLYAGRWYCIEEETKLNSVNALSAAGDGRYWTPDGESRVWIDGRLAYQATGLVYRSLPALAQPATYVPGFRELGIKHLWFNWFHGGLTQNSVDRVLFVSALAWGEARIGPMAPALPSWVPAPGAVSTLTVANGGLVNSFRDVVASTHDPFYSVGIVNDYSGGGVNPYWGTYGACVFEGAGHSSSNDNSVMVLELGSSSATFKRVYDPTNLNATYGISNNIGASGGYTDLTWGEYTNDGHPASRHSYGDFNVVGPEYGGAAYGTMYRLQPNSLGYSGANIAGTSSEQAPHKMAFASTAASSASWARAGARGAVNLGAKAAVLSAHVPPQQRIYCESGGATSTVAIYWWDLVSAAYVQGTGTARTNNHDDSGNSGALFYVSARNLLVHVAAYSGVIGIKTMDVSADQPSWVNTVRSPSVSIAAGMPWNTACWCEDNNCILIGNVNGDPDCVYEVEIPATLSDPWPATRVGFSPGQHISWYGMSYKRWSYNPRVKSIVYLPSAQRSPTAEVVYVYRPRGT
jgi:hypothetical protein